MKSLETSGLHYSFTKPPMYVMCMWELFQQFISFSDGWICRFYILIHISETPGYYLEYFLWWFVSCRHIVLKMSVKSTERTSGKFPLLLNHLPLHQYHSPWGLLFHCHRYFKKKINVTQFLPSSLKNRNRKFHSRKKVSANSEYELQGNQGI